MGVEGEKEREIGKRRRLKFEDLGVELLSLGSGFDGSGTIEESFNQRFS